MQPHDAIFKQFLSDIDIARDFLAAHLPPAIQQQCDFSTLQLESASFIENTLRSRLSDMLYSLQTRSGSGYIYCVIEHQSRPDNLMPFRLLRYCLDAMQQHLSQGHRSLPVVIPLLFYHGKQSPYPYSMQWLDHFTNPELAAQIYHHAFPLIDLTVIPDEEIKTHRRAALLELVQKHIRTRDMLELAHDIGLLFEHWNLSLPLRHALLLYVATVGNTSDIDRFIDSVAEPLSTHKEETMTIAQQLHQRGFEQGMQAGLQEGLQEGMKSSALNIARQLLQSGMEQELVQRVTQLSDEEMAQLLRCEQK
ncbi:Rpn family recombination-promoting nuclease/putative transposase [Pectobacterium punjabense]|uniref:Rpn family recombination-promoting nuclease/putative transposase n=1 Tax=Pectobacterium punjabense TaxID=2108399 RepID=A0ABX6KYL7_9GAMM|nr:Rpn family recombination-promoting nuclease/putative transposase [Pectobacterium punjabense]MBS4429909.1 Rpn family recombination-promoting nuclease/putative transposase [Pectobacterium punjabense]PTA63080.1 transposase [Pectobacterium punjabense]QJA19143.1 Rpn family recombination-promoting nuclease/putative transposase [Pectobacterium punjabense]